MACSLQHWVQSDELKLDDEDSTRLLMMGPLIWSMLFSRIETRTNCSTRTYQERVTLCPQSSLKPNLSTQLWGCGFVGDGRFVCSTNRCEILIYDEGWSRTPGQSVSCNAMSTVEGIFWSRSMEVACYLLPMRENRWSMSSVHPRVPYWGSSLLGTRLP